MQREGEKEKNYRGKNLPLNFDGKLVVHIEGTMKQKVTRERYVERNVSITWFLIKAAIWSQRKSLLGNCSY